MNAERMSYNNLGPCFQNLDDFPKAEECYMNPV